MSEVPDDLYYNTDHDWVKVAGPNEIIVGITDHAQHSLSDIVYVELPDMGGEYDKGNAMAIVESVKAASDVLAPISGKVTKVNEALEETPELINESPYEMGWIFHLEPTDLDDELAQLMDAAAYRNHFENAE